VIAGATSVPSAAAISVAPLVTWSWNPVPANVGSVSVTTSPTPSPSTSPTAIGARSTWRSSDRSICQSGSADVDSPGKVDDGRTWKCSEK
jgi:hypothetical protein